MTNAPVLKTERLTLRPFEEADAGDVLTYASDEEWAWFLPHIPRPYTSKDADEFVTRAMTRDWEKEASLAIELDGRVVGDVRMTVDRRNSLGALGYSLARNSWGSGLAVEAARAFIDWAIPAYDLAKVYVEIDERNMRSLRIAEKLGMKREALLRSHYAARDGRSNDLVYGILREEWDEQQLART
jgi:RimJ/RimL family protein N-acetyltransferase